MSLTVNDFTPVNPAGSDLQNSQQDLLFPFLNKPIPLDWYFWNGVYRASEQRLVRQIGISLAREWHFYQGQIRPFLTTLRQENQDSTASINASLGLRGYTKQWLPKIKGLLADFRYLIPNTCPIRHQTKKNKDYVLHPGTRLVDRTTNYANPFHVATRLLDPLEDREVRADAVFLYELQLYPKIGSSPDFIQPLIGFDLACSCFLDEPCHADTLLDLALLANLYQLVSDNATHELMPF